MKITASLTKSDEFHVPTNRHVRMSPSALALRDELNEKIASGEVAFETVPCLCGKHSFANITDYDKFGIRQTMVMCTACGLIQANPRMTDAALKWFYESDFYGKLYGRIAGRATPEFIIAESKRRPAARYEFIEQHVEYGNVRSVLEIGCAGGWSLYPFFKDGKKVVGYDYGPALVAAGKKLGLDLRIGTIETDKENHDAYDIILLCHVVEHLPHPIQSLAEITKHLAPNGRLYIEVPLIKEIGLPAFVNAHTYSFTKQTFLHYAAKAGLAPIAYQNDDERYGSQGALFERAPAGHVPPSLSGEYQRMKKMIERDDRRLILRRSLKNTIEYIGLLTLASYLSHLARKAAKRQPNLQTFFRSERREK